MTVSDLVLTNEALALAGRKHPVRAFVGSLPSANSKRAARKILDGVAKRVEHTWQSMPWHELTNIDVNQLKSNELARVSDRTGKPLSAAHINKTLWAVKGVMGACFDQGLIDGDTLLRIQRVKGVKRDRGDGEDEKAGRYITQGERERIIKACQDGTDAGARDEAVIAVMCAVGLRRAEVPALSLESILADEDEMVTLEIWGKGRKRRTVYVNNGGYDALKNWLHDRGPEPGPLFWQGRRGGHLVLGKGLGQHSIYGILLKRAGLAGVENITTHDLRRSWISDQLGVGTDIATVAALAGHASVTTTAAYDRRGSEAKVAACKALHFACSPARWQERLPIAEGKNP